VSIQGFLICQSLLEMSRLLMLSRTSQWHSMSRVGGRGGKGRQLSPFPPAHRLIELHCAHREYVLLFSPPFLFLRVPRFPEKNFAPGSTKSDDCQLCGPIASPLWPSHLSRRREFKAKLPRARQRVPAFLLSPANSASWCDNLVAKDDPGSACAAWRRMGQPRCI